MSAHVMYEGRRYNVVLEDVETGERVIYPEAYYYGSETDSTDFSLRFSVLVPAKRDEKRAMHAARACEGAL